MVRITLSHLLGHSSNDQHSCFRQFFPFCINIQAGILLGLTSFATKNLITAPCCFQMQYSDGDAMMKGKFGEYIDIKLSSSSSELIPRCQLTPRKRWYNSLSMFQIKAFDSLFFDRHLISKRRNIIHLLANFVGYPSLTAIPL